MVDLKQYSQRQITPTDDALFNDFILSGQNGIFEGCTVTSLGANQLNVSGGRGVILGRTFVITQEVVLVQLATSGTMQGRLLLYVDMENTSSPIKFLSQVADTLPALTQEDINRGGRVFELPLATYTVSNIAISNLLPVTSPVSSGVELARAAQTAANAAQTKANASEPLIPTGTTAQYRRGDKTWQDFATAVRAAALTGLSTATNAAVTAADTVLAAIGKLQAQVTAAMPKSGGTMTGSLYAMTNAAVGTSQVRNVYAGTGDMAAGSSALATGVIYFVYE